MAVRPGIGNIPDPFAGSRPQGDGLQQAGAILQAAINAASGGSSGGTSGGTSGGSTSSGTTTESTTTGSVCGPKPTAPAGDGYRWRCDSASKQWVRVRVGGESGSGYRPGQNVGGPDRVTEDGGAVVDGIYIPPGTFGGSGRPPRFEEDQQGGGAGGDAGGTTEPPVEEEVPVEEIPLPDLQQGMLEAQRQSAKAIIDALLADYDLAGLTDFVNDLIFKEDIMDARAILARIRTDRGRAGEIYRTRFAGNEARRQAGYNVLSEAEYVAMENTYRQIMRASGLPGGFYDAPEDFNTLIGGDVSPAELNSRISDGYQAVAQSNPQVINEMRRLYGVDDSMLAAYFLDPAKATPMLLRQARAAQIASEATLQAQQQIGAGTAEELAVAGVTQEQARQGFQTIGAAQELFVPLPGTTEEAITQEEQVAGVFGTSGAAQQRIRQRQRQRQAAFEAGGRFAGQGTTVTGLQ